MVSIIIPNYNHFRFLHARINSIIQQKYTDFEIILLDDYSNDGSDDILKSFEKHQKVSYLVLNKENSGSPFKQWQKGLALAKGEFIWIAESDDYASEEFLEHLVPTLKENSKVGLIYSNSYIVDDENTLNGTLVNEKKLQRKSSVFVNSGINELAERLIHNCSIMNVSCVLFRKEALENTIQYSIKYKYAGDWLIYILIAFNWDIAYQPKTLNYFRTHPNSTTLSSSSNYKNTVERLLVKFESIHFYNLTSLSDQKTKQDIFKTIKMELRILRGGVLRFKYNPLKYIKFVKQYQRLRENRKPINKYLYTFF